MTDERSFRWTKAFSSTVHWIERFTFDRRTKTREQNANQVSGVLVGSANTKRTRVTSDWVWNMLS